MRSPLFFARGELPGPRDFRLYLGARFFGTVAVQVQSVAVGWQVYDLTGDPMAIAYVGLFEFVPMMILALPAGDLADRVDRRLVLIAMHLLQAIASGLFLALNFAGSENILHYYLVVGMFGMARGIYSPAMQSSLPFLVSSEQLPQAIAKNSSIFMLATIFGPAVGGLLYILSAEVAYGVCLVLFLLTAAVTCCLRMRVPEKFGVIETSAYQRITSGVVYIFQRPILIGAISLDLFAVLLGGAIALAPIFARDILEIGPAGLGILRSAPAVGAAVVAFMMVHRPITRHTGSIMFGAVALFGVAVIVFGLSSNFYLSIGALIIMGGGDMVSVVIRSTFIQLSTPDHMRGRVSAVNSLFVSASNELGQFRAGLTAAWFGVVPAVVIGGVGALAVVGAWMRLFPPLRRVDRFSDVLAQ